MDDLLSMADEDIVRSTLSMDRTNPKRADAEAVMQLRQAQRMLRATKQLVFAMWALAATRILFCAITGILRRRLPQHRRPPVPKECLSAVSLSVASNHSAVLVEAGVRPLHDVLNIAYTHSMSLALRMA